MKRLKFFALMLFALGCGYGIAQLAELSEEELNDVLKGMEMVFGEAKVVEAGEGISVLERSKGGTAPNGTVVEGGLVVGIARIVKFRDGRATCYMLTDEAFSGINLSCVRTMLP